MFILDENGDLELEVLYQQSHFTTRVDHRIADGNFITNVLARREEFIEVS